MSTLGEVFSAQLKNNRTVHVALLATAAGSGSGGYDGKLTDAGADYIGVTTTDRKVVFIPINAIALVYFIN
jgi:hypothetical protein